MTTNDQTDLEAKLLSILSATDAPVIDGDDEEVLDDEQRKLLATLMTAPMETPDEIVAFEKRRAHNEEIQRRRDEKLARRKGKRKRGK